MRAVAPGGDRFVEHLADGPSGTETEAGADAIAACGVEDSGAWQVDPHQRQPRFPGHAFERGLEVEGFVGSEVERFAHCGFGVETEQGCRRRCPRVSVMIMRKGRPSSLRLRTELVGPVIVRAEAVPTASL